MFSTISSLFQARRFRPLALSFARLSRSLEQARQLDNTGRSVPFTDKSSCYWATETNEIYCRSSFGIPRNITASSSLF